MKVVTKPGVIIKRSMTSNGAAYAVMSKGAAYDSMSDDAAYDSYHQPFTSTMITIAANEKASISNKALLHMLLQ
jgi:hypothetical protein